ncbi:hypothetical protein ACFXGT_32140 [Streptomyces sp. NPDC059352]
MDLQDTLGITSLFISHDLPTVRHVCDRVLTPRDGRLLPSSR